MKRIVCISIFCFLFLGSVSLDAQSLVTRKEYHDTARQRVSDKWTELPDGTRHGKEQFFTKDGIKTKEINWQNGTDIESTTYFLDKSIKWSAKKNPSVDTPSDYILIEYSSFRIFSAKRVPEYQYKMYVSDDNLGPNYQVRNGVVAAPLGDYRVQEYSSYLDGVLSVNYKLSPDKATATLTSFDREGNEVCNIAYSINDSSFSLIHYSNPDEGWSIDDGVLNITSSEAEFINGSLIYDATPLNGRYMDALNLSYDKFYDLVLSFATTEDDYGQYLILNVPKLSMTKLVSMYSIPTSGCQIIGRVIDESGKKAYKVSRDGKSDGLYRNKVDNNMFTETWTGTYKSEILTYLETYLFNKADESTFITRGEIKNELMNGLGTTENRAKTYTVKAEGQYKDGELFNGTSTKQFNDDVWSEVTIITDGEESVEYRNSKTGDKYIGRVTANDKVLLNGRGKIIKPNGDTYDGYFINGAFDYTRTGTAYLCNLKDEMILEGEFVDHKFNGKGTLSTKNGYKYKGYLRDGAFAEVLEFTTPEGCSYVGQNKLGLPSGNGVCTYENGFKYDGEWKDGVRNGMGKLTIKDGTVWECYWEGDYMFGQVTVDKAGTVAKITLVNSFTLSPEVLVTFANGDSFEGEINGTDYLKGTYTFKDGNSAKLKADSKGVVSGKMYGPDGKSLKLDFSMSMLQALDPSLVHIPAGTFLSVSVLDDGLTFPDVDVEY